MFIDLIIMPVQTVMGHLLLRIVDSILLYKLELLAKCRIHDAEAH